MKLYAVCLLLTLTAAQGLAQASALTDEVPGVTPTTIRIGQSIPLSGPVAPSGIPVQQGTIALFNRINNEGGVGGRKLELESYDDGYDKEKFLKNYDRLINVEKFFAS